MIGSWPKKDGQKQLHNFNSGEGGGPLPSKPRGGRRAGTYNCSEILSYTGGLDGEQKRLIDKSVNCWILGAAFKRRISNRMSSEKCLSAEIPDAYRKRGIARKKRDDPHEPAPTNRSFVHFRWW
jgi:hypothetical protein